MKKEMLIAAAVKLYEVGTVSQERGAKMAYQGLSLGKNYLGFRFPLSKQKISLSLEHFANKDKEKEGG